MKPLPPKLATRVARRRPRLTPEEKQTIAELLPIWREKADEIEDALEAVAATIVAVFYEGDVDAAFRGDRTRLGEVFIRLGETGIVPFSVNLQSVMRRIAALNLLIATEKWRDLDWGQKTELLRLKTVERITEGAKHVARYELRRARVAEYVDARLAEFGEPKARRDRSLEAVSGTLASFADRFGDAVIEKVGARFDAADEAGQAVMVRALDEAEARLALLRRRLKVRRRLR